MGDSVARARRRAAAIIFFAACALGAAPARADEPFALRPAVDGAWLGGALVLWIAPALIEGSLRGPSCDPCDASRLSALDRPAIDNDSRGADIASDVLAVALPAGAALGGLLHVGDDGWRALLTDTLLVAQSMASAGVLSQLVRHAVRRPRPFMYVAGARGPETRTDADSALSFYSGHTTTASAAIAAFAYIYFARRPQSWTRWLVLGAAAVAASAMPILRVASGEHFPSDVLVGVAAGSAFGILVPALHHRSPALSVAPSVPGGVGLALAGRFY